MRSFPTITALTVPVALIFPSILALQDASVDPLSIQMSNSIISRHQGLYTNTGDSSGPLQAGFVQKAFSRVAEQYTSHTYTSTLDAYITQSADSLLNLFPNATSALRFSMDRLSSGNAFIDLYQRTGDEKYRTAFTNLKGSLDENQRNREGGLWYYVYPQWSYLDGMFSFGPFFSLYTLLYASKDVSAWDDLRKQFALLAEHCSVGEERGQGLLVHGYDESQTAVWANNSQGASPHVWGRSLGWYVIGLLDTVEVLDMHGSLEYSETTNCTGVQGIRDSFHAEFKYRMEAIAQATDPVTGGWWQVIDEPGRDGNYIESSGSSMFTYALLRGVRKGYLDAGSPTKNSSYIDIGKRAHRYLRDTFVINNGNGTLGWNGTVSVCSLNSTASYDYYIKQPILYNSVLGSAAFVLASLEVERLEGYEL